MQRPLTVLNQSMNNRVIVELKGNRQYRGVLDGYDPHMNLVIKSAEELINNEVRRKVEITIVRGDNVIYISPGRRWKLGKGNPVNGKEVGQKDPHQMQKMRQPHIPRA